MTDKGEWIDDYEEATDSVPERKEKFETLSGETLEPIYTPEDIDIDYEEDLGYPGDYPFTRGPYTSMYRSVPWTRRQLVGLQTPEEFNKRQRKLIERGQEGLNFSPDNTLLRGLETLEVDRELLGKTGTTIDTLEDWRIAFENIPIGEVSVANNEGAPYTLAAMHFALAEERDIPFEKLSGTTNHSDYLNQYVGSMLFHRFPLDAHERLQLDHIEYCLENVPRWNPVSLVGQNIQQKGATPAQEAAFCISANAHYVEKTAERGFDPDDFVKRFAFHFNSTIHIFEEIAKFRAARRVWAKLLTDRFDVSPDKAMLRFHCQTDGVELTQDEPLNNIARVAIQALAPVLGGAQSIHTDAYDEALRAPSKEASRIALRTQQILAEEGDIADVIDPLGGSYFVENLTNDMEERIWHYIEEVEDRGGMKEAVNQGYPQRVIEESAQEYQEKFEDGRIVRVGLNKFETVEGDTDRHISTMMETDDELIDKQLERTRKIKGKRDDEAVDAALTALQQGTEDPDVNLFELTIKALKVHATTGEVIDALWEVYGDSESDIMPTYAK